MVTNYYGMEKRAIDVYDELIKEELPNHNNNRKESFHKVNDEFEQRVGFKVYKSYQAYKNARSRRNKEEEKRKRST